MFFSSSSSSFKNNQLNLLGKKTNRNDLNYNTNYEKSIFNNIEEKNDNENPINLQSQAYQIPCFKDDMIDKKIKAIFPNNIIHEAENSKNFSQYDGIDFQIVEYNFKDCSHKQILPKFAYNESINEKARRINENLIYKPKKNFKFKLDKFQERSILCLENQQSLLVSAHTSAGKTVVAEYAIAMCLQNKKKVIFTSPIKALSNQKFRDFKEEFNEENVGLMTGDNLINPSANCLVMTTEILRNILYEKNDRILKNIEWVIFDEIHYIKEKSRGIVWEETIILLPKEIKCLFLSATIPNSVEFASWIFQLKEQPVNIIYTQERPVPINHSVFYSQMKNILEISNKNNGFNYKNWDLLSNFKKQNEKTNYFKYDKKEYAERKKLEKITDIKFLFKTLNSQNNIPAIFFCFFKKECDDFAHSFMCENYLTNNQERDKIDLIINKHFSNLKKEELLIPQVNNMIKLLKKGVGYHHSGLIPIVRECVEILFQSNLIKILFSTETLAMGVNLPAKTVVFTKMIKYDDANENKYKFISNSDYIQISGRCGRRGKDTIGLSISMLDNNKLETLNNYKNIIKSESETLFSSFSLRYFQILSHLINSNSNNSFIDIIGKRSFYQFQIKKGLPLKKYELMNNYIKYKNIVIPKMNTQKNDFFTLKFKENDIKIKIMKTMLDNRNDDFARIFESGRILKFNDNNYGILISFYLKNSKTKNIKTTKFFIEEKLENISIDAFVKNSEINISNIESIRKEKYEIKSYSLADLIEINDLVVKIPKSPVGKNFLINCEKVLNNINTINLPIVNYNYLSSFDEKKIIFTKLKQLYSELSIINSEIEEKEKKNICSIKNINLIAENKKLVEKQILKNFSEIELLEEFQMKADIDTMEKVLIKLSYINSNYKLTLKGIFASVISSCNEILLTEMIFNGEFDRLEPIYIPPLLSCFIKESGRFTKDDSYSKAKYLSDSILNKLLKIIENYYYKTDKVFKDCNQSSFIKNSFVDEFKSHFMESILDWAKGKSFADVCSKTEIYEGNLISNFKRVDELIDQLIEGFGKISFTSLVEKFKEASCLIKRDIVAEKSLWLS